MIKYLECPDLHSDEKWIEINMQCLDKIIETAKKEQVDFVALPGDLHNKNFYLTKAYNQLREKLKELLDICPICAVVGTPGHENEEMYKPLEDLGLMLLRPDNVYGYNRGSTSFEPKPCIITIDDKNDINTDIFPTECILFGVPELNTKYILAKYNWPADQANAEVVRQFDKYIEEYVAPQRLKYKDIPAIMLFHGEVSDSRKENTSDVITKNTGIVIHTEILEKANLNRISLGHRHGPWESEKICAGYAGYCGIDDCPWNYLDVIPGMNLIEINNNIVDKSHIRYDTPIRKKIYKSLGFYNPDIAYWLETDNPDDKCPTGHPWSRITYKEKRIETQRISEEQAANIKTLADLFMAIDPDVTKPVLEKVNTIQENITEQTHKKIDAKLLGVEVAGCILFHDKIFKFDLGKYHDELISLQGDNGTGKSSGASFCHFYPCIIGKDTNSGRMSAIKDFFDKPVSYIKKWGTVNGQEHKHNIQIQGAHTRNPKVVCSLVIDGIPALDKGTFDEMYNKCEELYGSFNDYMLTSFYVQPLQSKNGTSGLMMANMTDIRDLVQSIAGVDRESEKRYALDQVAKLKQKINDAENWLKGAEQFDVDIEPIEKEIIELCKKLDRANVDLKRLEEQLTDAEKTRKELQDKKTKNDIEKKRKDDNEIRIVKIKQTLQEKVYRIEYLESLIKQKTEIENKLNLDSRAQETTKQQKEKEYDYEKRLSEYNRKSTKITNDIRTLENRSITITEKIALLDKKCPNCGYLDPGNKNKIKELQNELETIPAELKNLNTEYDSLVKPKEPNKINIEGLLDDHERNKLQQNINDINSAEKIITEIKSNIDELTKENHELNTQIYVLDDTIESQLSEAEESHKKIIHGKNNILMVISAHETEIKNLEQTIKKIKETKKQIKDKKISVKDFELLLIDWKYIASMLQSDKIPALELSLITDSIDKEATKALGAFEANRYSFRTTTQDVGKKGLVDNFDIKIYDAVKGQERSFLKYNVGHKAFFNDAYVKALIRKRNERMHRNYNPIISDEADGPIQASRISEYYEMQKKYFEKYNAKVIVISHAPGAHQYIQNVINMEDLLI